MSSVKDDSLYNVVQDGIKEDIDMALTAKRFRATVMLIYAGMDAMASLSMPTTQVEVKPDDFVAWVDRYIRFPCRQQITGNDFFGARCGMLHTYGMESRKSRHGKCRMIGYLNHAVPEVRYDATIDPNLVLVSVKAMRDAFFSGIDKFLIEALSDHDRKPAVVARLEKMVHEFPYGASAADEE